MLADYVNHTFFSSTRACRTVTNSVSDFVTDLANLKNGSVQEREQGGRKVVEVS